MTITLGTKELSVLQGVHRRMTDREISSYYKMAVGTVKAYQALLEDEGYITAPEEGPSGGSKARSRQATEKGIKVLDHNGLLKPRTGNLEGRG